ncbi:MAG: hypothetical protein AB7S74_07875 [Hyphomicrobium sp.]
MRSARHDNDVLFLFSSNIGNVVLSSFLAVGSTISGTVRSTPRFEAIRSA